MLNSNFITAVTEFAQIPTMETPVLNDTDLMRHVVQRDQSALSELYERYGNPVYGLALRVVQNTQLAEEVTQDTFLKVWNQAQSWDPTRGQLISWLLTITRYTAIDRLRREWRQPNLVGAPVEDIPNLFSALDMVGDARWQDGQLLAALIQQLPDEQAEVVQLAFYQGMTHTEMSERLGLPLGTVKTRVRLGLQKLKSLWLDSTERQI
jgi:RNA polymerase sigma-70 factor, ECF subfamily